MPGVPTSRGCDACRKQKKKCDEAKPACGRCARLRIECSGAGQQRFKFHNTTVHRLPPHCRKDRHEAIVSRLASALEVRDPRYDLSVYGAFLFDIPRRIGRSPALDAAAEAFTASLPLILSAPRSATAPPAGARPTTTILSKYGTALYALRASLSDPRKVATPDTLCALYLIVICQGWLHDDGGPSPNHGEAISMILQAMKSREGLRDDFEQKIMSTLCFVVILESFVNPRIQLETVLWGTPHSYGPTPPGDDSSNIESLGNDRLASIAIMLRSPQVHQREITHAYDRLQMDRAKLECLLSSLQAATSTDGDISGVAPVPEALRGVHVRWHTGYAMLTLVSMRMAGILAMTKPPFDSSNSPRPDFAAHMAVFIDGIATVAEQALRYHPLGSSVMPLCLLAAYYALRFIDPGTSQRANIQRLFSSYRPGVNLDAILSSIPNADPATPPVSSAPGSDEENAEASLIQADLCVIL